MGWCAVGCLQVIIHRAILGSVERMFAILLEHYAGKWPLWLSPRQVIVCPVSEKHSSYALEVWQHASLLAEALFLPSAEKSTTASTQRMLALSRTLPANWCTQQGALGLPS